MPKKILIYSSFPPARCGIAKYAAEDVLELKSQGDIVYTASFHEDSVANYRVNLISARSIIKFILLILFNRFDGIHIQYAADFFFPLMPVGKKRQIAMRFLQLLLFLIVSFRSGRHGKIIFHEAYAGGRSRVLKKGLGFCFSMFSELVFHTETEKERIRAVFPFLLKWKKCVIRNHENNMTPKYTGSRIDARKELAVPVDKTVFLCIGFIQEHKNIHHAVQCFDRAKREKSELYIVGTTRTSLPEYVAYKEKLTRIANKVHDVYFLDRFVEDREFDCWLVAADAVIQSYKDISSSGVAARCKLHRTDIIYNSKTNLASQLNGLDNAYPYEGDNLTSVIRDYSPSGLSVDYQEFENSNFEPDKPMLFIMPWFGRSVPGGAEQFIFNLCCELAGQGKKIEVWATSTKALAPRDNGYRNVEEDINVPVKIRRFTTNILSSNIFRLSNHRMNSGKAGFITGLIWKYSGLYGKGMAAKLKQEKDRFSTIHLCHYFSGSTHRLADVAPEKTIVHPFIHNEPHAFHNVMRKVFACARGVICNTMAEATIAAMGQMGLLEERFFPIGNGIYSLGSADKTQPAKRPRKNEIIYIGRLIPEKNLDLLIKWVRQYNEKSSVKLKLNCIGKGPLLNALDSAGDPYIHFSGWTDEETKRELIRHAIAVVQPSLLESFSLVMIEAWAEKTPVIVHKRCRATAEHIERSGAGFAVADFDEFEAAIDVLITDENIVATLGEAGFTYAKSNYSWGKVVERFEIARSRIMNFYSIQEKNCESYGAPKIYFDEFNEDVNNVSALDNVVVKKRVCQSEKEFLNAFGSKFNFISQFRNNKEDHVYPSWYMYKKVMNEIDNHTVWIDIGAGQGSFLKFLKREDTSLNVFGVEPDSTSYRELRKTGIPCCSMTADNFLRVIPDKSLRVVSMLHVVEHMPWRKIFIILRLLGRKISENGVLIIELPYSETIKTSATYFWMDPTHLKPVAYEMLYNILKECGFADIEKHTFAPVITNDERMKMVESVGSTRIVDDLYGPRDLSIIARK